MKEFYFNFSVSKSRYDRNLDAAKTNKLQWREVNGNIDNLVTCITNNFAFCNCFNHSNQIFTNHEKNDKNLKSANLICLDLDAVKLTFNDFVDLIRQTDICPNLVYTTANNGIFKPNKNEEYNNRYRVIYVTETPIYNAALYSQIHQDIKKEIELITNDTNIFNDNTDINVSHFFAGNKNAKTYINYDVFTLDYLVNRYEITTPNEKENNNVITSQNEIITPKKEKKQNYINDYLAKYKDSEKYKMALENVEENADFINDFYTISFIDILSKYVNQYDNFTASYIEQNENEMITKLPSNYIEIKRKWEKVTTVKGQNICVPTKRQNGQMRRATLFKNLMLRKQICPNISICSLLYDAIFEMVFYIDNTDQNDIIHRNQIAQMAVNAYFSTPTIKTTEKRKYVINKSYCQKHDINPKTANMAFLNEKRQKEKEKRETIMKDLVKAEFSDKENLNILKANGIIISRSTLQEWKTKNGIKKIPKHPKRKKKEETTNENTTLKTAHENEISKPQTVNENKENEIQMKKRIKDNLIYYLETLKVEKDINKIERAFKIIDFIYNDLSEEEQNYIDRKTALYIKDNKTFSDYLKNLL